MKRKKWSELEEQSLLSKYSDLHTSGALSKLKTREKKFRPIADHVNAAHHGSDPAAFPFRWSWRDVSIKVQNMRHQYLCVKQKIRLPDDAGFNWDDGDNHWPNFLAYKSVFGDIELDSRPKRPPSLLPDGGDDDDDDNDNEERDDSEAAAGEEDEEHPFEETRSWRARRMEQEAAAAVKEERAKRRRAEERREEEEMEWRERMLAMQLHHEKEMMRMQAEASHTQMQLLGAMTRLVSQFFVGGGGDGMGGGLGAVLGDLEHHHHPGGDNAKPDSNSPSEFL